MFNGAAAAGGGPNSARAPRQAAAIHTRVDMAAAAVLGGRRERERERERVRTAARVPRPGRAQAAKPKALGSRPLSPRPEPGGGRRAAWTGRRWGGGGRSVLYAAGIIHTAFGGHGRYHVRRWAVAVVECEFAPTPP